MKTIKKFYRPYPYLTVSMTRMIGGGGSLTGENDPSVTLFFAVGKRSNGPFGGKVEFQLDLGWKEHKRSVQLKGFSLGWADEFLGRRSKDLGSFKAAQVERCAMLLDALKAMFPGWRIRYNAPYTEANKDPFDEMLVREGVLVVYMPEIRVAGYAASVEAAKVHVRSSALLRQGWELCGLYTYDFRMGRFNRAIAIETKNVRDSCEMCLKICTDGRQRLLDYCDTLPSFFRFSTRNRMEVKVPYVKMQLKGGIE